MTISTLPPQHSPANVQSFFPSVKESSSFGTVPQCYRAEIQEDERDFSQRHLRL